MTTERVSVPDLDGEPHAGVFAEGPRTVRLRLDAGETVAEHRHPGNDVLLYVVDGLLDLVVDGESCALETGDVVRFDGDRAGTAFIPCASRRADLGLIPNVFVETVGRLGY